MTVNEVFLLAASVLLGALIAMPLHVWSWRWRERRGLLPDQVFVEVVDHGHRSWHGPMDPLPARRCVEFWHDVGKAARIKPSTKETRAAWRDYRRSPHAIAARKVNP